jgi:dTDP-4-dehydrorhamnose 3,5-epimerase
MVRVVPTTLSEVLIVESPVYGDARGSFTEVYHEEKFAEVGLPTKFVQDNHSRSGRHVLRGLHYQVVEPQGKLVRAATGVIFDVAVDLRRSSPTFGHWVGETLEAESGRQIWIPEGFGHGFLVLSEVADVTYKCTRPYRSEHDRSVRWDDPRIGVDWPLPEAAEAILAERDRQAPLLAEAEVFP